MLLACHRDYEDLHEHRRCAAALQVLDDFITMAGYPAWPLRFSEFYAVGRLGHITSGSLDIAWQRYHKTSQRFGT